MSRYHITESVGSHVENVQEYADLAKHHPSAGRQRGRDYATIDGQLEEVRHLGDGRTMVKKDFILSQDAPGPVYVPAPAAGYVHYLHDETNAVRLYDRPFGEPGAKLLAQALHMTPGTSPREGAHVEYGQHLGRMGDTGSPGSVHAHVEMEPAAFRRYVHDISSGAITPDRHPPRDPATQATPAPAARTQGTPAAPAAAAAAGTTELSNLIGRGEGGYNSYNRGHAGDSRAPLALTDMTVGEIMRRQALPGDNPERLFAVGKFQMVPGTMSETARALHIDPATRFTPALQERMFADYLVDGKRPAVHAYITGQSSGPQGLQRAQVALSQEFASVADPRTGRSYYDGDSAGNHSSITAQQTQTALEHMRTQYQANVQRGMAPDAAYRALSGQPAPAREQSTPGLRTDAHAASSPGERVLREGSDGADVGRLQRQLNALGVRDAQGHPLTEDRDFGQRTREAVESFQRSKGLGVDGVAGRDTFAALHAATAAHRPDAVTRGATTPEAHAPAGALPREPLLSDPTHPRHALFDQAMTATGRLPAGTFRSEDERRNASATLAFEASVSGLRKIDEVVPSTNGKGLFAVEGALADPAHHRVYADKAQAIAHSVEQSTQQLRQDTPATPQVTPLQPEQERKPMQIA